MTNKGNHTQTLAELRAVLKIAKRQYTYDELAELYKVNKYYLWMIINKPNYHPPIHICNKMGYRLTRKRYRPECAIPDDDQRQMIDGLSKTERLIALVEYAILKEGDE